MIDLFNNLDLNAVTVINEYLISMGESQRHAIFVYCQRLHNGIGIINRPPGTGKSTLISAIVNTYIADY